MTSSTTVTTTVLSATLSTVLPGYDEYARDQKPLTGWTSPDSWATKLFRGDPSTILFATIVTLSLPVLLHIYFYTQASRASKAGDSGVPTFVLLGPSNAGKTSLVTLLQDRTAKDADKDKSNKHGAAEGEKQENDGQPVNDNTNISTQTRASQISYTTNLRLPPGTALGSNKYRSENDPEVLRAKRESSPYDLIDTPGHGKLRPDHALSHLTSKPNPRGVIFMLDSTVLDPIDSTSATDTIAYLHDTLLTLQRQRLHTTKKQANDFPVLIAANKQDLFTALPPLAIKQTLETALQRQRTTNRHAIGVVDSTSTKHREQANEPADEDETVLAGTTSDTFTFNTLRDEFGLDVQVLGGTVRGDQGGRGTGKWEAWIGSCL